MSYIANQWGPAYRGVTGHFKKAVEIINLPWNLPFITGFFAAGALILSIPVSGMYLLAVATSLHLHLE